MVESIGPNRISSITRNKGISAGTVDKSKKDGQRPGQGRAKPDKEKPRIGANIDEHC